MIIPTYQALFLPYNSIFPILFFKIWKTGYITRKSIGRDIIAMICLFSIKSISPHRFYTPNYCVKGKFSSELLMGGTNSSFHEDPVLRINESSSYHAEKRVLGRRIFLIRTYYILYNFHDLISIAICHRCRLPG